MFVTLPSNAQLMLLGFTVEKSSFLTSVVSRYLFSAKLRSSSLPETVFVQIAATIMLILDSRGECSLFKIYKRF